MLYPIMDEESEDIYIDALDCETVTLEDAGLENKDSDNVCAAQIVYYIEEGDF